MVEIRVRDLEKAKNFYGNLFNWRISGKENVTGLTDSLTPAKSLGADFGECQKKSQQALLSTS